MTDTSYAPVCGIYCGECHFLGRQCAGCGNVEGKPFWALEMPGGICPLHDCCRNQKHLEHCGLCHEFPCKPFLDLRDPNMTDDEFTASLNTRRCSLTARTQVGTEKWLAEKTNQQRRAR